MRYLNTTLLLGLGAISGVHATMLTFESTFAAIAAARRRATSRCTRR